MDFSFCLSSFLLVVLRFFESLAREEGRVDLRAAGWTGGACGYYRCCAVRVSLVKTKINVVASF